MSDLCDYCKEREGIYKQTTGKLCCEIFYTQCPENKRKNREANMGKHTGPLSEDHKRNIGIGIKKVWGDPNSIFKSDERGRLISEWMKINNPMKNPEVVKKSVEARKGQKCSEETRKKLSKANKNPSEEIRKKRRLAAIKKREELFEQVYPNYNPEACKLIEEYGKESGYDFQHAENGGEFYIKELGYWVDGYDKNKNIVIEVDEPRHFDGNGNLLEKDIRRQQEIEEFLSCEFIRLKIN